MQRSFGRASSAFSGIGFSSYRLALADGHPGISQPQALSLSPYFKSSGDDSFFKRAAINAKFFAQRLQHLTGNIAPDSRGKIRGPATQDYGKRKTFGPDLVASHLHPSADGFFTDAHLAANLFDCHTGLVETDRVTEVTGQHFSGHIYDISTKQRWYTANGIITHNCVEAQEGHFLMQRTANAGTIVIPTAEEVLALYTAETGFTPSNPNSDQGTSMASDALYMCSTGLLGHKADATGWVNPANLANLQWCIQLFGGIGLGVNLPQSALDQFNANQAWAVVADDGGIVGGHDIFASKYDGSFVYCITWAELVAVTPEWILKYADEAHGLVFLDWIEATGVAPSGLNLVQLVADLQQLSVPQGGGPKRQHRHWRRRQRQLQAERDSTTKQ